MSPLLVIRDAGRAIEFYGRVFEAAELMRLVTPEGKIVHAEIRIGDSLVMIAEERPEWGNLGPESIGGTPCRIHVYVPDVDAVFERALAAGASVEVPLQDQFYGDRTCRLADPFGHSWIVSTRIEDMSHAEMQRRMDAWMAEMSGGGDEGGG